MITAEELTSIPKDALQEFSKNLSESDISQLVDWLSLKDDNVRYPSFLLLQSRSLFSKDLYPYWDVFYEKLSSENSYQRSIGLMLIADNVQWDTENKLQNTIDRYLKLLYDEKPITVRQCIQSLQKIITYQPNYNPRVISSLISFDLSQVKDTMRKSILLDILNVLLSVRKSDRTNEAEAYILSALSGEILDKKTKKQIESQMLEHPNE